MTESGSGPKIEPGVESSRATGAEARRTESEARPWSGRRLHFVGVGGAGMSGYARAAYALGAEVSGSDRNPSPYTERLAADGVLEAVIGEHAAANVPAYENVEVVYSSAVPSENEERAAARARGLAERPRAELLAELTALRPTIAVAGTHGKTTTSSMLVWSLRAAGLDPGWLVGGSVGKGQTNAHWSDRAGSWLVVEADESDRSMLELDVDVAVLTNVEFDHHATFASLAELRDAFRAFLERARAAIVVWDRPELLALAPGADLARKGRAPARAHQEPEVVEEPEVVAYDIADVELAGGGSTFEWRGHEVALAVPGAHNALNATAALEAARLAGADEARAVVGLTDFKGAGRRFQLLGTTAEGAFVYDDYAHHPTEVEATLAGARTLGSGRLIAVFQPHLFSRTAMFARQFGVALGEHADVTIVLDVYPARERAEDHPGVSGLLIAQAAADAAGGRPVYWLPGFADAEPVLKGLLGTGDVCVAMGAGDIDRLAGGLVGE